MWGFVTLLAARSQVEWWACNGVCVCVCVGEEGGRAQAARLHEQQQLKKKKK